jgi:hypothetical protein
MSETSAGRAFQTPPTQKLIICNAQDWTLIPVPTANNPASQAFADAEQKLRAEFAHGEALAVAFRARGDCAVCYDIEGIHPRAIQNAKAGAEFQVLLMDGSELRAAAPFTWNGNVATVDLGRSYTARLTGEVGDVRTFHVQEREAGKLLREFTCRVSGTQAASATPSGVRKVEEWCRLQPSKLPEDRGIVSADLSYVLNE